MSTKLIIFLAILILAVAYLLRCIINNINGIWICHKEDGQEQITIWQLGPIVRGICEMEDGKQVYSGRFNGRKLMLKRMDYGLGYLEREGFPPEIGKQLEGTVMATMELHLSKDKRYLEGIFYPQAIEFVQNPPKIRRRRSLKGKPRKWMRMG